MRTGGPGGYLYSWIFQRNRIRERHTLSAEGEFHPHIAINAARSALADAGVEAQSID